jgi:precorrin-2/cobalt-factor-2 C20-methyltransferase
MAAGRGQGAHLILPCPEDAATLRAEIESHDIVVLMKVGARLPWVLDLLREMDIAQHCGFARRIGLEGEVLASDLSTLDAAEASGYLAVLLIRKTAQAQRHRPPASLKGSA